MDSLTAQTVVESLRKGMPPDGHVKTFTVGRGHEITKLTSHLENGAAGALLLKANYGSGKTHLLRFVKECALTANHAVSFLSLDAKSAIRFNRMDQILGAIWRGIQEPSQPAFKGPRTLLQRIANACAAEKASDMPGFWSCLSNKYWWNYSEVLESPAMFVAIRAWMTGDSNAQRMVEDWLCESWVYQKRDLYQVLVGNLRRHFRDPRSFRQFSTEEVFNFRSQNYHQSWSALRDIDKLARETGLAGFTILFDEFEDVLTNLNRIDYQEAAFWNLFMFYSGRNFKGGSFFAVTPDFAAKCKRLQLMKGRWDFDYSQFENLAAFEMSPLGTAELEELASRIMHAHAAAYDWEPDLVMKQSEVQQIVRKASQVPVQDRARHTIKTVVQALDRLLQE